MASNDKYKDPEYGTPPPSPVPAQSPAPVQAEVDFNLDLEDAPQEPVQVEPTTVIFVPFDDFEANINRTPYQFHKDVPTRIEREHANLYLESKKGYIRD